MPLLLFAPRHSRCEQSMEMVLKDAPGYNPTKVPKQISDIADNCLKKLNTLQKPFKYVGEFGLRTIRFSQRLTQSRFSIQSRVLLCKRMGQHCTQHRLAGGIQNQMVSE